MIAQDSVTSEEGTVTLGLQSSNQDNLYFDQNNYSYENLLFKSVPTFLFS